jgi:hypothetical protein
MNDYDPKLSLLRQMLALSIVNKMEECGFELMDNPRGAFGLSRPELAERVYTRKVGKDDRMSVRVYTTVIGGENDVPFEVRKEGKDAIRVCAIYETKDGSSRGIAKETRINRTGNIDDIIDRMHKRMRSVYKTAASGERCHSCNAPKFVTKAGKLCCAEICWKTDEQKRQDAVSYRHKSRSTRHRRRSW